MLMTTQLRPEIQKVMLPTTTSTVLIISDYLTAIPQKNLDQIYFLVASPARSQAFYAKDKACLAGSVCFDRLTYYYIENNQWAWRHLGSATNGQLIQ